MAKKKPSAQDTLRSQVKEMILANLPSEYPVFNLSAGSLLFRGNEFDVEIRVVVKKERVELPDMEEDGE